MSTALLSRIKNIFASGRGRIESDTGDLQAIQVQINGAETKDSIPRVTEYGFQSAPPDGFTALTLFFSGNKSNGAVIATSHPQFRMKNLNPGEVSISDNHGQMVYLTNEGVRVVDKAGSTITLNGDGTATITCAGGLTIDANTTINGTTTINGDTQLNGTATATGNITSDGDIADQGGAKTMAGMRNAYNAHHHGGSPTPDVSM